MLVRRLFLTNVLLWIVVQLRWGPAFRARRVKCQTTSWQNTAMRCAVQDIDVETLMQEIKQWGPQDHAAPPAGRSLNTEPGAQTPRRGVSPGKAEQAVASPSQGSLTPDQSPLHEDSSSSSDKVIAVH